MALLAHILKAPSWKLSWRTAAGKEGTASVLVPGVPRLPLMAELEETENGCRLWIEPLEPLMVASVEATIEPDMEKATALFLNGYNSWTDSCERPLDASMAGLAHTPKAAIRHWVLDASGDYRFCLQNPKSGHQHGEGYGYLRYGDETLLFGECLPDLGLTTIQEDLDAQKFRIVKEGPARLIEPGERICVFALCLLEGTAKEAFARFVTCIGKRRRPAEPLVGFTSWYRHYGDIDEEKLVQDLAGAKAAFSRQVPEGILPVFQIDDGYTKVGDWTHPSTERFPHGMGSMAEKIAAVGLLPGLWIAPFVCEKDSRLFHEHQDWLLRDEAGNPVMSGSHWSGGYALDTLNPEVRSYVHEVLGLAADTWGFRLLKLDFLYAAALLPHGGKNRGELMADALDLLRDSVPEGTLFDLCGVPIMSAIGRTEYCRIGCDVGLDWDGAPYMRISGRERVSTKNALGNIRGRAHMDGVAFLNDPDVFFLRDDVKLSEAQKKTLLEADASLGSVLFTSDDMGSWSKEQKRTFEEALHAFTSRKRG